MVPDLSRRRLLAGAGLATAGVAGATTRVGVGPVEGWTPPVGTWPHDRYGPRNAAANPHANPPDAPGMAWRAAPVERVESLVVGPGSVYVGGTVEGEGRGVAALDRAAGEVLWTADAGGATLALRRETLYAAARRGASSDLLALDPTTGDAQWRTSVGDVRGIVVADGVVFAGSHYRLVALDAESGRRRWTGDGDLPAVADDALIVSGGRARRHRQRRVSDVVMGDPPPVAWEATDGGSLRPPVVADGRVVVGQGTPPHAPRASLHAFDLDSGEREWATLTPRTDSFPTLTGSPAVRAGRAYLSYRENTGSDRYHALVACSLADGTEQWRWETTDWVTTVAVAGDTVLAGTAADPDTPGEGRNRLVAFGRDGRRAWSFETAYDVRAVAAVGGTVFVGTEPAGDEDGEGMVYALR